MSLLSQINLLQGTRSERDYSTGNTLPLIARPWGLHHWTPQTAASPWRFHPDHRKLQGIRLTHQPSPWMEDYGNLVVSAFTGACFAAIDHQASAWRVEESLLRPNRFRTELLRYRVRIDMAPTSRGAVFVFENESSEPLAVRFFFEGPFEGGPAGPPDSFAGVSRNARGGTEGDFGLRWAARFHPAPVAIEPAPNGHVFRFSPDHRRVEMRLAGSLISIGQAWDTLRAELADRSLEEVAGEGERIWEDLLGRVPVAFDDPSRRPLFLSCLYRCLLFPRFLGEEGPDGVMRHYSPYDGRIHQGSLCADSGFWDTYRTLFPLLGLFYPDILRRMMDGWLNACREAGWSPKWPSPGPRDCMIGTHFDVVAADAVARGVVDWNIAEAYEFLRRDATEESEDPRFGRAGLSDYLRLGYVPADRFAHATAATLDYCLDDFCVAQVARFLGREEDARVFSDRAGNYRNVFDASVGFMRGRLADGSWRTPFSEFEWGGPFIEGGAWQHTFNVPHDPAGLAELFGGGAGLCRKLDAMLAAPRHFGIGDYPCEIHEMTEMALAPFGQYAHSNQPVHHFPFLYALAGRPEKTAALVHRVAGELYTIDGFPGDEDNGEMAAWYVFACLGIFPVRPGTPDLLVFPSFAGKRQDALGLAASLRGY